MKDTHDSRGSVCVALGVMVGLGGGRHGESEASWHRGIVARRHEGTEARRHEGTEARRGREVSRNRNAEICWLIADGLELVPGA